MIKQKQTRIKQLNKQKKRANVKVQEAHIYTETNTFKSIFKNPIKIQISSVNTRNRRKNSRY